MLKGMKIVLLIIALVCAFVLFGPRTRAQTTGRYTENGGWQTTVQEIGLGVGGSPWVWIEFRDGAYSGAGLNLFNHYGICMLVLAACIFGEIRLRRLASPPNPPAETAA